MDSDFDGGQWMHYGTEDIYYLIAFANQTEVTVWKVTPFPNPSLLKGKIPA